MDATLFTKKSEGVSPTSAVCEPRRRHPNSMAVRPGTELTATRRLLMSVVVVVVDGLCPVRPSARQAERRMVAHLETGGGCTTIPVIPHKQQQSVGRLSVDVAVVLVLHLRASSSFVVSRRRRR